MRSRHLVASLAVVLGTMGQAAAPALAQSPSVLPACSSVGEVPPRAEASPAPVPSAIDATSELTVFGAASLRNAFEALMPSLAAATGIAPSYSFDASSALRAQIEEGAPADVFASADTANVRTLLDAGLATDPVAFACNQLTIIVPAGNPAGITSAADLGRPGLKVIAAGDEVPITRYAMQLVEDLGIADAYAANIVTREDNVAAVRSRIELGEGDAGIVYLTDAIASGDAIAQVSVPAEANVPATYAAAVVADTDQPAESGAFLTWLTGPQGQGELASFGFLPAP
jgi:molybdate transport system substrate-binding protein